MIFAPPFCIPDGSVTKAPARKEPAGFGDGLEKKDYLAV